MNDKYHKGSPLHMKERETESSEKKNSEQTLLSNIISVQNKTKVTSISTHTKNETDGNDLSYSNNFNQSPKIPKLRKDYKGNQIIKGKNKKHHISFKDFTGRHSLIEVVNIEKIKENDDVEHDKVKSQAEISNNNDEVVSCTCLIF